MYKTITLSILLFACGCTSVDFGRKPVIHPKVFEMAESWLSDTAYPVITEVNLDAVEENRNQFDYTEVSEKEGWTICPGKENEGFLRYKVISQNGSQYTIRFQHNGGGSLTTESEIEFIIYTRTIFVDKNQKNIKALKILSIKNI